MERYGSYLVCKEYIQDVRVFLSDFFDELKSGYTHSEWISFKIPGSKFLVNLMRGDDQNMTQNFTIEIYCDSKEKLEEYSKKYLKKIESFVATKSSVKYKYNYIEVFGPQNICKVEISYSEDLKD